MRNDKTYEALKPKELGIQGERQAARFLVTQGYVIEAMNYRSCFGEIDIIAALEDTIVFVEVKTRRSLSFGLPREAIDFKKRQHIKRTAQLYLQTHPYAPSNIRFDSIDIVVHRDDSYSVKHIKNCM